MVAVAQLVRAPVCGTGSRGFEPHQPPKVVSYSKSVNNAHNTFRRDMKKLALFDIDNTLYRGYSIIDIAAAQAKANILTSNAQQEIERLVGEYKAGSREYEPTVRKLVTVWARGLEGQSKEATDRVSLEVFRKPDAFFGFVPELLRRLRKTHAVFLVTANPFAAESFHHLFEIDGYETAHFPTEAGVFTGELDMALADRSEKLAAIKDLIRTYGQTGSLGFGDSEGDIGMLEAVETAFCINASAGLEKHAKKKGWLLETPDTLEQSLDAVLTTAQP
jgi:phosphoserine phosphatase